MIYDLNHTKIINRINHVGSPSKNCRLIAKLSLGAYARESERERERDTSFQREGGRLTLRTDRPIHRARTVRKDTLVQRLSVNNLQRYD